MILRTLDADYKSFMALRANGDYNAHPPGFKGKKYFTTMIHNQSGFKIKDGNVTLTQFYKKDIPLTFDISKDYNKIYQVSVFHDGKKYYVSIVHEVPEKPYEDNGLYQAIDLGITKTVTAINTQAKFYESVNPRQDKYWNPIVDKIQSKRDHCKKGGNKWNHLHKAMNKRKKKCSNQIKNTQHKLTRKMVDQPIR